MRCSASSPPAASRNPWKTWRTACWPKPAAAMIAIDTNLIVRYLTGDHPEQSARAQALVHALRGLRHLRPEIRESGASCGLREGPGGLTRVAFRQGLSLEAPGAKPPR